MKTKKISIFLVVILIIGGMFYFSKKDSQRPIVASEEQIIKDDSILEEVTLFQNEILYWLRENRELPETIKHKDSDLVYKKTGTYSFDICSNFEIESKGLEGSPNHWGAPVDTKFVVLNPKYSESNPNEPYYFFFPHPKGYYCFDIEIPESYLNLYFFK